MKPSTLKRSQAPFSPLTPFRENFRRSKHKPLWQNYGLGFSLAFLTVLAMGYLNGVLITPAVAQDAATDAASEWLPDTGDTAWMMVSTALVLLMTPGLAFF